MPRHTGSTAETESCCINSHGKSESFRINVHGKSESPLSLWSTGNHHPKRRYQRRTWEIRRQLRKKSQAVDSSIIWKKKRRSRARSRLRQDGRITTEEWIKLPVERLVAKTLLSKSRKELELRNSNNSVHSLESRSRSRPFAYL